MLKNVLKYLSVLVLAGVLLSVANPVVEAQNKIDFILDWVPNTNHTGLYVALDKGYFDDAGVEVDIKRPPQGSTTELIGLGQAAFGISFQDSLAHRLAAGLPVTAVATILEHNTSGVLSNKDAGIIDPLQMTGHSYGTWNDPIELAMLNYIIESEGGDFEEVQLVPNQADNSVIGLANNMFDSAWVYYAWDGIMADHQGVETNFWYFKDYASELDFYSPVIIANNDYLAENPDEARAVIQAIKKGYQYAMENSEEAANILMKYAPELSEQADMVKESQEWISDHYASDIDNWGYIEEERWNDFYHWLFDNELIEADITLEPRFTNEFLGE
ncbi:ABC transporter substrate-binding protein [Fundicoccus sp. Sow4_H7]|uniref:ABC transporter substrate-binding protein n=1 Tax=Fundicoccus sp. Sow4_H7 TaxID=3438784 RepID=UPI003F91D322